MAEWLQRLLHVGDEIVGGAPRCEVQDLVPVGHLDVLPDLAYNCGVVLKLYLFIEFEW